MIRAVHVKRDTASETSGSGPRGQEMVALSATPSNGGDKTGERNENPSKAKRHPPNGGVCTGAGFSPAGLDTFGTQGRMKLHVAGGNGMSLTYDLSRGAKIMSIRGAGVEWLAQPRPGFTLAPGAGFLEAEMAGWDECAPTIVACRVGESSIPDHGDLWDTAFEMVGPWAVAKGTSYPYEFARKISATAKGVRLNYRAHSLSSIGPIPFLWAAHPQFAAPRGTRVMIDGVSEVVDAFVEGEPRLEWDYAISTIDSLDAGECRKVYVSPELRPSRAQLVRPEGTLTMSWSSLCGYLGVYFDKAAFSEEPVIALEPTTGYFDSLATATDRGRVAWLQQEAPCYWHVDVEISVAC